MEHIFLSIPIASYFNPLAAFLLPGWIVLECNIPSLCVTVTCNGNKGLAEGNLQYREVVIKEHRLDASKITRMCGQIRSVKFRGLGIPCHELALPETRH